MLLALALAGPASAAVSGTYDPGTGVLTVTMSAPTPPVAEPLR